MHLNMGPPAKRTATSPLSFPMNSVKRAKDNAQASKLDNLPEELLEQIISYMGSWEVRGLVRVSRKFQRLAEPRVHMPGPQLDDLSDDILEKIIAEIDHEDLLSLIRVSTRFRRPVEKRLYAYYSFLNDGSDEYGNGDYKDWRGLCHLIRTLVERPDLAAHMRTVEFSHVEWRDEIWGYPDREAWGTELSEELWATARARLDMDEAVKDAVLSRQQPQALMSAAAMLLLCLLPNLERLSFEAPLFHEPLRQDAEKEKFEYPLANLMRVVSNHPSEPQVDAGYRPAAETRGFRRPLARLQHLIFTLHDAETEMNYACLALSAGIASLRETRTFWMSGGGDVEWPSARSINIKDATFLAHEPDIDNLFDFCHACKALRSLALQFRHHPFYGPGDIDLLRKAIFLHSESLESLLIDEQGESELRPDVDGDIEGTPAIGSLKALRRLKALSIPGQLLTGWRRRAREEDEVHFDSTALIATLPTSLEVLTINGSVKGDDATENFLVALANASSSSSGNPVLPNLRQIELRPRIDRFYHSKKNTDITTYLHVSGELVAQLRPIFASHGVKLLGPEGAVEDSNISGGGGASGELYAYYPKTRVGGCGMGYRGEWKSAFLVDDL